MRRLVITFVAGGLALFAIVGVVLVGMIAFGGPEQLPPLKSVSDPFRSVDFSDLPPVRLFTARDGTSLAYRAYSAAGSGDGRFILLVHGSSATGTSMHPLAKSIAAAGYPVYALDMRGHGASGTRGQIGHVGQLEEDVVDFLDTVHPGRSGTMVGFSSGGGFALRFAAGEQGGRFDNYVLLSPFLSQDAGTVRPSDGGWVSVGVPRVVGLVFLNRSGIQSFNGLPVISFALAEEDKGRLSPTYSFALATNFRPHLDYRADIRAVQRPMEVLVGEADELFFADKFDAEFRIAPRPIAVTIVPAVGHIGLTTTTEGARAIVAAIDRLAAH